MTPTPANAPRASSPADGEPRLRWITFALVTLAYLAVTVGESLLAPVFPAAAQELGLDLRGAGLAFGLLTGSIAAGSFAGGHLLARAGVRTGVVIGLVLGGVGAVVAAGSGGRAMFLASQVLLGLGAGIFFAPGIKAAALVAGPGRRGLAMGVFGVAFSAGLALAAVLAAAGATSDWRLAFWVAAGLVVAALVSVVFIPLPSRDERPPDGGSGVLRKAFGVAVGVGTVGAISQYGTVAFFPAFAVTVWGVSPARAAVLLAVARILSAPAKLAAGAAADRWGVRRSVRGLSALLLATGLWWTLVPSGGPEVWVAAVAFAATVSALFPIANLLAVESFRERGALLGTYRSVQIGIAGVTAYAMGTVSSLVGLRPTLVATVVLPAGLFALRLRATDQRRIALRATGVGDPAMTPTDGSQR